MIKEIRKVAAEIGIDEDFLELYGKYKAKINLQFLPKLSERQDGKLILVSAITPTPAGEGKTTVSIGLSQGLNYIGKKSIVALRQPSLGPIMGIKGGATGGGKAALFPAEEINLHFTGDFHAVAAAHNLIAATIDNHIYYRQEPLIDSRRVRWPRTIDMNDRALRSIIIGLGGAENGFPRESGFIITAASEIMAVLCLSENYADLKQRIENILVGFTAENEPVFVRDLKVAGAAAALLRDALKPNLVQTVEGTPAFVHGGPFANIAQGTNAVIATRMALRLADYVVTEVGFGFDLGAEKFFDLVARSSGLCPSGVVLVATVRALKMHGGKKLAELAQPDPLAVERGLENLGKHMENIALFGIEAVVAINRFSTDSEEEIEVIKNYVHQRGYRAVVCNAFEQGGKGAAELAEAVVAECQKRVCLNYLYSLEMSVEEKIAIVSQKIYGAQAVDFTKLAQTDLKRIKRLGLEKLPICIAKTQKSLSDNPALLGRPKDFLVTVREIRIASGAGFLIPITGEILLMPGLSETPAAEKIDLLPDGSIRGIGNESDRIAKAKV